MAERPDKQATDAAGWRPARALCTLSNGRFKAEEGDALNGFYVGIYLLAAEREVAAFLNLSEGGGSLHVRGSQILDLDWTEPKTGAEWPARTLALAAEMLGLTPPPMLAGE
jgi:hypothetical protein